MLSNDNEEKPQAWKKFRLKKKSRCSSYERIYMAKEVVLGFRNHLEVANDHKVKRQVLKNAVKQYRMKPDWEEKVRQKDADTAEQTQQIWGTVEDMIRDNTCIATAQTLIDTMKTQGKAEPTLMRVRDVLKSNFDLTFRSSRRVTKYLNLDRSKILRMEFARMLLTQMERGKRIINIDETWIGSSNFQRMHW
jgi:hypothetical protein